VSGLGLDPVAAVRAAEALLGFAARQTLFAALVFAVVWPISRLVRRRSPRLAQGLWVLVLIRLVLPPGLASPLGVGTLAGRLVAAAGVEIAPAGAAAPVPAAAERLLAGVLLGDAPVAAAAAPAWPVALAVLWLAGALAVAVAYRRRLAVYRRAVDEIRAAIAEDVVRAFAEDPVVAHVADEVGEVIVVDQLRVAEDARLLTEEFLDLLAMQFDLRTELFARVEEREGLVVGLV
jgi:beta-lactamase regulating signal transducer with metallopeptidase domain